MKFEECSVFKVGDKVRMKPARKNSTISYKAVGGKVLTIKEIFPQLAYSCTFEEIDEPNTVYRLQDVAERL